MKYGLPVNLNSPQYSVESISVIFNYSQWYITKEFDVVLSIHNGEITVFWVFKSTLFGECFSGFLGEVLVFRDGDKFAMGKNFSFWNFRFLGWDLGFWVLVEGILGGDGSESVFRERSAKLLSCP